MTEYIVTDHYGNVRIMSKAKLDQAIAKGNVWDWHKKEA